MRWYERFFRRELTERRLDAELRFHLEQRIGEADGHGTGGRGRRHKQMANGCSCPQAER